MNDLDATTFARFAERFARIERQVPEPPRVAFAPVMRRRFGVSPGRRAVLLSVVLLLAAAMVLAMIGSRPAPLEYTLPHFPDAAVSCDAKPGDVPPLGQVDPCISLLAAVERATADIGLPIERVAMGARGFPCNRVWGSSQPPCDSAPTLPGWPMCYMHAWVSFANTASVAGVLFLLPEPLDGWSSPIPADWHWSRLVFEVPPPGWTFP